MLYSLIATGLLFLMFLLSHTRNKARLTGAWLFCLFLLSAGVTYTLFVLQSELLWLSYTLLAVAIVLLLVVAFGLYALVALLLVNARVVLKRERKSLKNSLTLLLGLGLTLYIVLSFVLSRGNPPQWVLHLWTGFTFVLGFYFVHIFIFLTATLLCNLARPKKNQDFILVLGCGLLKGQVTPLLARRIDRALSFYHLQAAKSKPPVLLMSGGQGPDEPQSEAEAMKAYALQKGIPEKDLWTETKSANTYENMAFSKELMDTQGEGYRCIYATSNYHLLRAGILARKAGLSIDGIGAKTALYYLPNALLREYAAFFWMNRLRLGLTALFFFAGGVSFSVLVQWAASL